VAAIAGNRERSWAILLCGAVFFVLSLWLVVWPFTGETDSVLHFLTAQRVISDPKIALGAWARPLHKLLLVGPASFGIIPARGFQAILTIALMWQTTRLAEELCLKRAWLTGAMLIWQPLVFALGSDTMTEIPFALGTTIALRLWNARRFGWSCVVAGLLPLLRPEGFALAAGAALLTLINTRDRVSRRLTYASLALIGAALWAIACMIVTGNWRYFIDVWSWPMSSYQSYGHGSLLHYLVRWPWYCGWILFPLFCLGIVSALRERRMRLPLALWGTIFVIHTLLYWRGMFASIGEMRILVTTSSVTALVCLYGWNLLANRGYLRPAIAWTLALLASGWVMVEYARHVRHYECFAVRDIAKYIQQQHLVESRTLVFTGDKMLLAELNRLDTNAIPMNRESMLAYLRSLPVGTVGMWDNRNAQTWYGISIDELPEMGFTILHEYRRGVPDSPEALVNLGWKASLRYVVLRKD